MYIKGLFLCLLILLSPLGAEEPSKQTIASMIEAIKKAPADQRYKKVNAFKKMLRSLNQENRMAALKKLQNKQSSTINQNEQQHTIKPMHLPLNIQRPQPFQQNKNQIIAPVDKKIPQRHQN